MKREYEEMMRMHGRLCNELHSCVECVYNKDSVRCGGGCFCRWLYDVLVDGRDEDLPLDEEF